ncbi:hypothetical protein NM208_g4682 [Fusarium decemcellulare]|uniref:Uncharacterized protein n=2 Tax=Fusarium decemcellulare TaxID=57161 RepID=A0ACC1SFM4_9HYPO|nr:hypothetical protein NM208_g5764 [Fusarium decemcellulare]KAJ3541282.1 hypothetical protein NM208_g4682 [Fusarium decemcellulare]
MAQQDDIVEFEEEFTFPDDGTRPDIESPGDAQYNLKPKDMVYLNGQGPYFVESSKDGKYSLCDKDWKTVHNGKLYEEKELSRVKHFTDNS